MSYYEILEKNGFKLLNQNQNQNLILSRKINLICPNGHKIFSRLDNIYSRLEKTSKGNLQS